MNLRVLNVLIGISLALMKYESYISQAIKIFSTFDCLFFADNKNGDDLDSENDPPKTPIPIKRVC